MNKELQDKIDSIIDWLTEPNGGNAVDESDIRDAKVELKELKEQLRLHNVSKSVAKQYAEFCVRCDREGLPLLELDDYIKQYCC